MMYGGLDNNCKHDFRKDLFDVIESRLEDENWKRWIPNKRWVVGLNR